MEKGNIIKIANGKMQEIAKQEYTCYADKIQSNAATSVNEHSANGVKFGEPKQPPPLEMKAKVAVYFRPNNNWTGEFGFDWMRVGDTALLGDNWYKNIIGKNRNASGGLLDIYNGGNLVPDVNEYTRLMRQFKVLKISWKNDFYIIPWLSLYMNQTAKLSLKIEIEEPPKKLEFQYDESLFELNHKEISQKSKGKTTLPDYLTIKCIKTFNEDKFIKVFADDELAGTLRVHKNGKVDRKKVNVVLAKVKTNVSGTRDGEVGDVTGEVAKLKKHLNQALVSPHVVVDDTIDLSADRTFKSRFINAHNQISYGFHQLHDYMLANYGLRAKYPGYFIIYVFGLSNPDAGGEVYNVPSDNALVFSITTRRTTALVHEFLHGLGLHHTFGNDSNFTFSQGKTENIMDYLDTRRAIWKWQWDIIRSNTLVKPE